MRKKLIAGAAAASLVLGLGMTQLAQAETPTPTTSPSATSSTLPGNTIPARGHHDRRGDQGKGLDVAALATALGLPEADVSDALSAVRQQAMDSRPNNASPAERDAAREAHQAVFAKALADELGIDEARVVTAMEGLRAERGAASSTRDKAVLDQAVTEGTLTQNEADAVQKAIDAGIVSTRGGGGQGSTRDGGHGSLRGDGHGSTHGGGHGRR